MALTVPGIGNRAGSRTILAFRMRASPRRFNSSFSRLGRLEKSGSYLSGTTLLHLESDFSQHSKDHTNLAHPRDDGLRSAHAQDLHYSGVVTFAVKDALSPPEKRVKTVQQSISFVTQAKNEEAVFCLPWTSFTSGARADDKRAAQDGGQPRRDDDACNNCCIFSVRIPRTNRQGSLFRAWITPRGRYLFFRPVDQRETSF